MTAAAEPVDASTWTPEGPSLQARFAPESICFGCGPANREGLRIESYQVGDEVVGRFAPAPHHHAFVGVLNGGIIGALLDCHSNWAAAVHLLRASGASALPCTVTADFHVKLRRPTPSSRQGSTSSSARRRGSASRTTACARCSCST
jgi:acyl-coenzyme A thioesterase PaaI-like protein